MNQLTPFTRHLLGDDRLKQLVSPFVVSGEDVTTQALAYLQNSHRVVTELMQKDVSPLDLHRLRSLMMDELIRGLWQYFSSQPDSRSVVEQTSFALMATGGYGREEMSLLSDIDLLFVVPSHRSDHYQQLAQKLLYVLWDLKLDVGHAVRTFDETLQYLHDDHTIFTALLNLRLIVGDASLFENLLCQRDEALQDLAVKRRIFLAKYDERQVRLKKFGDTVYLLEPHIKEGEGGLRDLQLIRWMAQIVGVGSDYSCLCEAGFLDGVARDQLQLSLCFLLTIRNKLHAVLGRKSDQITFDAQIILAKELDFEDDAVVLGVEKFMQAYYTVASQVNRHVKTLIQKLASPLGLGLAPTQSQIIDQVLDDHFCIKEAQIAVRDDDVFEKDITHLMDAFLHV
ncbi:MAG TPA: DUF294 nucleotidyltransferase-like domain-containing protein, partial [bacterium]|nr:DUF294 nucleotidyltransferase-like domain-containing protein [bacterium]